MDGKQSSTGWDPREAAAASLMAKGLSVPPELAPENRKILLVGQGARFTDSVLDYALNLADRLGYDLVAVNVGPASPAAGPLAGLKARARRAWFCAQASWAWRPVRKRLKAAGLKAEHQVRFGGLGEVMTVLHREKRRIEFVLNATDSREADMLGGVSLPVFTISTGKGEMNVTAEPNVRQVLGRTLGWGAATVALYAAVFLNSESIMGYFTRGGWYAALPVATVFLFSYIHGTFAHHLWEALGIRAPQQKVRPQARPARRQRPRPRLRLNV
ncbi:MAG: hypothetical protein K6T55_08315 [Syntrophobacterales bacterium]|nr:hypothetical protein [Syntrophobacterales bacterium]